MPRISVSNTVGLASYYNTFYSAPTTNISTNTTLGSSGYTYPPNNTGAKLR